MLVKCNLLIVLAGLLSAALVSALRAQDYDVLFRKCYSNGMPDEVIVSCSTVIARGLADKKDLATAYKNRGNAYDDEGAYDRALEDFEQRRKQGLGRYLTEPELAQDADRDFTLVASTRFPKGTVGPRKGTAARIR